MKKRKIGIMGGTFNPIHNGHLALAQAAYKFCELDEVWFMPSGVSYLKNSEEIAESKDRLAMTRQAVEGVPHFRCSDIEVRRLGNTYTADTLRDLKEAYPQDSFYFILGADSLFGLPSWKEPAVIAGLCTLVTVVRDEVDMKSLLQQKLFLEETFHAQIMLVPFQRCDISSSMIRKRISEGKDISELLPEKVEAFVKAHGLYRS